MPFDIRQLAMTPEQIARLAGNAGIAAAPIAQDFGRGVAGQRDWLLDRILPRGAMPPPRNALGGLGGAAPDAERLPDRPPIFDAAGQQVGGGPPPAAPAPVLFSPSTPPPPPPAADDRPTRTLAPGYVSPAEPPLAGTDMPAALGGRGPSWDRLREDLGADVGGRRVSAPRIFNSGEEQHPLARIDDVPQSSQESLPWQLYHAGVYNRGSGDPALRQQIIDRYGQNQNLQNEYYNMGRGMYTIPRAHQVSETGLDPTRGLGTAGRLAGAAEMTAGAHQTQALTDAAKAEYAMGTAAARQRFMERFPHATPEQLDRLVAGEEARGGFAPTTLRFLGGGARPSPSAVFPVQGATPAPMPGASFPIGSTRPSSVQGTGPAASTSSLLDSGDSSPAPFASLADRAVPLPRTGQPAIGPGEFMMQLARSNPQIFATQANRDALRPYLESRFGLAPVAAAVQGTRSFGGLSWSPANERLARGGAIGAIGQAGSALTGAGGSSLAGYLSRLSGAPQLGPVANVATVAGQSAPGRMATLWSGARGLAGKALGAPLALLEGALAAPAAANMIRSGFGGMTPEQEGNAILEAALGRNQW